jgi:diadenosine tetraphosphatase ApaH/serine/threonine PP2A family protein phosphatase
VAEQQSDGSCRLLEGDAWTLDPERRYLVNAGSVGQPRDGDPRAAHLIYDSSSRRLSVRRTLYDHVKVAKMTEEAGLPEYLAKRLLSGK